MSRFFRPIPSPPALRIAAALVVALAPAALANNTAEWPQYRGPGGLGAGSGTAWTRDAGQVGLAVDWKRGLGSGYASLVVGDGRTIAFYADGDKEVLVAMDSDSGKELWRHEAGPKYAGHDGSHDGALSTPAIAGKHVVALHPTGRLFAVDAATGKPAWEINVTEKYGANAPFYGFASSPLVTPDSVILQIGGAEATVAAFDAATGEERWKVGGDGVQYQTPSLMRQDGRDVVLAAGIQKLYGIDAKSGETLWSLEYGGNPSGFGAGGSTPVPAGDGRVFVTHKADGSAMVQLTKKDGKIVPEIAWETRHVRHSYAAPVYHDGHLYTFSSRFLICLDAATGEPRWRSREPGDGFLTLVDDHLIILTREGTVHVAEASPEGYREVAGIEVFDDHAWSPPSFAGGHIYVRSLGEVARIGLVDRQTRVASEVGSDRSLRGTRFGKFLDRVSQADDKQAVVDEFMADVKQTPIVEDGWVHFVYRGEAQDVAVAGDLTEVEREQSMRRIPGTDLFHFSHPLESDARLNYVLMVDYEQKLDPRNPRSADVAVLGEDMTLSFAPDTIEMSWFGMPQWREPAYLREAPADRQGRLEDHEVPSEIARAATPIQVYVPAGYDKEADRRYPVVYVHGGPAALSIGGWKQSLDNLIGQSVEPVIAVFIGAVSAGGPQAVSVVADEIVPFVDSRFRTRPEPTARANAGGGFGGNSAMYATFGRPQVFGHVAAQGPFLTEFAWTPLQQIIPSAAGQPLSVYLDWGKYDMRNAHENWNLAESNARMADYLKQHGFEATGGEAHDGTGWTSWRNRTGQLLESLFPLRR